MISSIGPKRRFSNISIRTTIEELERKRKGRLSVGVKQQPTTRPTTRRTLAFLLGRLKRFSVETEPVASITGTTLSIPRRHQSYGTLSGLIRLQQPPEPEWDFVCRGESPIVPPRDPSDELTLLGNDQSGRFTIGCSSLAFSAPYDVCKKFGPCRVPSPSSTAIRSKSVGSAKISIGSISHPIPISYLYGSQTYDPSGIFIGTTFSTRFASCKQDSE
ncbi:hypothetical protein CROQUDRAFT_556803 [Cronartium quercuum f. sp. fusiforme G11]|uniref:Uncharacterized protein n=1 Tax=Cronartium quercuum f. sp. fusiforme G11 TaxID=708437 RepID=A0A9P6NF85_9BASI|nr:hypothetical protein CROQUDRAFT_556803 [Cronartium quercuum f. sp. fusiforme G11]